MSRSSIRFISYLRTEPPPSFVPTIVEVFRSAEVQIGSEALAKGLTSDAVLTVLQLQLETLGFQVEKGKVKDQKIERPVFFGENGVPTLRYQIDAYHPEWRCGLEVEAGRAWMGNAIYRDLIQALVMVQVDHLVLAVSNIYKYQSGGKAASSIDYRNTCAVADALYSHTRVRLAVSFYEAVANCEWLTDRLRRAEWTAPLLREQLASGWAVTLPSEAEWEKAARGRDGIIYPWGNERDDRKANIAGPGPSSAVGVFLDDRSPYGALDMTGNVREWTRSVGSEPELTPYPYDPLDAKRQDVRAPKSVRRVTRGGAYMFPGIATRPALRLSLVPEVATLGFGFRLVFSRLTSSPAQPAGHRAVRA